MYVLPTCVSWVCVGTQLLSPVQLFATPWTVACPAPLSMEFSRQESWSGLPFSPPGDLSDPGIEPASPALVGRFFTLEPPGITHFLGEVAQSCPTLCDPVDCSLPGSSVHGISQAGILEWVAIPFSRGSF